jgi:hypothetical protein
VVVEAEGEETLEMPVLLAIQGTLALPQRRLQLIV